MADGGRVEVKIGAASTYLCGASDEGNSAVIMEVVIAEANKVVGVRGAASVSDSELPIAPVQIETGRRKSDVLGSSSMNEIEVRPARMEEAEAVLAFWAEAAEGTSISDDLEGLRALVERDPDSLLLALAGPGIVGTVIAGFDGWRCHLYRLAVAPDRRRQGIGSMLLEAAHHRFESLGGRRADAMVLERNETAQHAWDAAGYKREDHWRRWVRPLAR